MKMDHSVKGLSDGLKIAGDLPKCQACGCMKESLLTRRRELDKSRSQGSADLLLEVESALAKMQVQKYT